MSERPPLSTILRSLAPHFPDVIQDHGFCLEVEGRQYLLAEVDLDPITHDRIQGALQRLCRARGWHYRLVSRSGGNATAHVVALLPRRNAKRAQAHAQPCPHVLATAMGKLASTLANAPAARPGASPVSQQITHHLAAHPGLTTMEISAQLDLDENVIRYELRKLLGTGRVSASEARYNRRFFPPEMGARSRQAGGPRA